MCSLAINSTTCNAHKIKFYCKDCEITKNCSNELYRSTHEWLVHNCKSEIPPVCKTDDGESLTLIIVIAVLAAVIIVILAMLSGWFYNACTRPNSPSGKWLDAHWIGRTKNPSGSIPMPQINTGTVLKYETLANLFSAEFFPCFI